MLRKSFLLWAVSAQVLIVSCGAQPFPWQTPGTRNNFCDFEESFRNATRQGLGPLLPEALKGATVSVLFDERPFETVVDSNGNLEGGFFVNLVREAARRGGFTLVEDVSPGKPDEFPAWTGYMSWAVDNYDLFAEWYPENAVNLGENNVVFPITFLDLSLVLVIPKPDGSSSFVKTAFSFLAPFHVYLWLACLAGAVFSGIIFMLLEKGYNEEDFDPENSSVVNVCVHSIWVSFCMFTGAAGYSPRTGPGKFFVFFWSFLSLLVVSAYTANLAMFMVVKNSPNPQITSLKEASERQAKVCIFNTAVQAMERIRKTYPVYQAEGMLVEFDWGTDMLSPMREGKCQAAIMNKFEWDGYRQDVVYNEECDVMFPGRSFWPVMGGFPMRRDNTQRCTSFVREVLSSILPTMVNDDFVDDEATDFWNKKATVTCSDGELSEEEAEGMELKVESMVGAFGIHIIVSGLVLLWAHFTTKRQLSASASRSEGSDSAKGGMVIDFGGNDAAETSKGGPHHNRSGGHAGSELEELRSEMLQRNQELIKRMDDMSAAVLRAVAARGPHAEGRDRPSSSPSDNLSPDLSIPEREPSPAPPQRGKGRPGSQKGKYVPPTAQRSVHGDLVMPVAPGDEHHADEWFHWPWDKGEEGPGDRTGGRL